MHIVKEMDMLAAKIDILHKKIEDYRQDKVQLQPIQALDARMMCEVSGNTGHSGSSTPKPKRKSCIWTTTMGFICKEVRGGTNHAHTTKEVMVI